MKAVAFSFAIHGEKKENVGILMMLRRTCK